MEFHRLDQMLGRRESEIIPNWRRRFAPTADADFGTAMASAGILFEALTQAKENWPYYKVWPDYLDMFRKTRLDNIPATELNFPFNVWTVLLPKTYELSLFDKRAVAMTVSVTDEYDRDQMLAQAYGETEGDEKIKGRRRQLQIDLDTLDTDGDRNRSTVILLMDNIIQQHPGISVENAIKCSLTEREFRDQAVLGEPGDPSVELWNASVVEAMRIMLSVAFIATGEYRFTHRDVLTADLQKMLAALAKGDQETVKRLGDKADRRRGETGHTIGKFHALDLLSSRTVPVEGETEEQRELRYQHLRSGHFHAYWCGPGRKERKVRFLAPVIVRPDLPTPSASPARLIR